MPAARHSRGLGGHGEAVPITDAWLWRSLLFIAAGAVLAFAVDVHVRHIDIYRVGLILIAAGARDFLLNLAIGGYYRYRRVEVSSATTPPPAPGRTIIR